MHDMIGLAMLFELTKNDGRRKHEFDHLIATNPVRARLYRLAKAFGLRK